MIRKHLTKTQNNPLNLKLLQDTWLFLFNALFIKITKTLLMFQYMPVYNDMYNLCLTTIDFLCYFKHFISFVLKLITFTLSKDFDENYNYTKTGDLDIPLRLQI